MGHVLALLTDPYTGGGAMQGAAPGIGVANRLWLFTDKLPFKVLETSLFCGGSSWNVPRCLIFIERADMVGA